MIKMENIEKIEKINRTEMMSEVAIHVSKLFTKGLAGVYAMELIADFSNWIFTDNIKSILDEYDKIMSIKEKDINKINGE